jgi:RNA polymerase sigma factor (sigma-70 family)
MTDSQMLECELLVVRCQRGDAAAFSSLVAMWERPLFYYLRRLAPSEAETWDILQETWLKTFRSLSSLRDPRALPAFLYKTARNAAVSRLRLRQREEELTSPAECVASPADEVTAFENAEQVHHALDQLPIAQREALTLYFLQDLSLDEIATVLGVPLGTVKSRLHYGKFTIRRILQGDDHE